MKTIVLFRHGKSDWNVHFENDHDRPINKRGINAAKKMGKYLAGIKEIPELLISSTAHRTRETIELAAQSGNWKSECIFEPRIYGGSPNVLIEIIKNIDEKFNYVCLIGHEPNFSSFISKSCNEKFHRFPTASMAKIVYNKDKWVNVMFGSGQLEWIKRPKEL
ncbi:MAG: histidine phosphatase family protein [bacterium TMED144]|nr:MAG: histidine phosphatase family protein [bacterium TMED144]